MHCVCIAAAGAAARSCHVLAPYRHRHIVHIVAHSLSRVSLVLSQLPVAGCRLMLARSRMLERSLFALSMPVVCLCVRVCLRLISQATTCYCCCCGALEPSQWTPKVLPEMVTPKAFNSLPNSNSLLEMPAFRQPCSTSWHAKYSKNQLQKQLKVLHFAAARLANTLQSNTNSTGALNRSRL